MDDDRGAFVLSPNSDESTKALSRYITRLDIKESHEHLFKARLMIEPELSALVAKRITEEEIAELDNCMEMLRSVKEDPERWIEADLKFHKAIAKVNRNPYALVIIETLLDHMGLLIGSGFMLNGDISATITCHDEIFKAIKKHQPKEAEEAMRDHVLQSSKRMSPVLEIIQDDEP